MKDKKTALFLLASGRFGMINMLEWVRPQCTCAATFKRECRAGLAKTEDISTSNSCQISLFKPHWEVSIKCVL